MDIRDFKAWVAAYRKLGWMPLLAHAVVDGRCTCGSSTCKSAGKHPAGHWAVQDNIVAAHLDRFLGNTLRNLGLKTGRKYGLVVVDLDVSHGDEDGLKSIEGLPLGQRDLLLAAPTVLTGSGRMHLYFAYPKEECDRRGVAVRNAVGVLPGVDIRGGGGFVVCPPSVHRSGAEYAWKLAHFVGDVPLLVLPSFVLDWKAATDGAFGVRTFPEGARNSSLVSIAGRLRRTGAEADFILARLMQVNEAQCSPPLSGDEVAGIVQSVVKYAPAKTWSAQRQATGGAHVVDRERSDSGNAQLLADLLAQRLRYDHDQGRWMIWQIGGWTPDKTGSVSLIAVGALRQHLLGMSATLTTEAWNAATLWFRRCENMGRLTNMLKLAATTEELATSPTSAVRGVDLS